jgi:hypothetical protein
MMFLARYWRVLAVAAVVGAILAYHTIQLDKAEQRGYDRATAEGKAAIAKLDAATAAREAEEREISRQFDIAYQEKARGLQDQIDRLTARNVDLGRLRKCADRREPKAAGASPAAAEPDGAAGRAFDDLPAGGDLGIQLVRYAGTCEQYRQQLNSLQSWVRETFGQ